MDLMFGSFEARHKLASQGKVNLRPLFLIMACTLTISYISYICFGNLQAEKSVQFINSVGLKYVPAISISAGISENPDECAFVMTVQWLASLIYAWVFFVGYFPFSGTMRLAYSNYYALNPLAQPKGAKAMLLLLLFCSLVIACVLGDFGMITFPTFFNGGLAYYSSTEPNPVFLDLINSPILMPFLSWFLSFSYIMIFWMFFYMVANVKVLMNNIFES